MSTAVQPSRPHRAAATKGAYRVTGPRVLRAEWFKIWSLRSTWITLGVALGLLVLFGFISAFNYSPSGPGQGPGSAESNDAVGLALGGMDFAELSIGVLGVLLTAGEYSTGMIRSTMAAVPRRLPVLWSKAAAYFAVVLIPATLTVFAAFMIGKPSLAGSDAALDLTSPGVLRSLLGAGLYLALGGVMATALGMLLRSVAGGIGAYVVGVLLLGNLIELLPGSIGESVARYLPGNAGDALYTLDGGAELLSPGAGLAVFAGWVAVTVAAAAYRLKRSDV